MRVVIPDELKLRFRYPARALGALGAVAMIASVFLPWSYGHAALDDTGYYGSPSPLQLAFLILPVIALALLTIPLVGKEKLGRYAKAVAWNTSAKTAAIAATATVVVALAAIAIELGGVVGTLGKPLVHQDGNRPLEQPGVVTGIARQFAAKLIRINPQHSVSVLLV